MTTSLPASHITDAQKLIADAEVNLYQLYPLSGGTIYFKNDNDVTWLGNTYEGLPISLSGEKWSSDTSTPTPRLVIGQDNIDLLPFKGLIHDGYLEGARLVRYTVLLANLTANLNFKQVTNFRIKRVESYSRTKITLVLSTASGATNQSYPFRQYVPPAFPWVEI